MHIAAVQDCWTMSTHTQHKSGESSDASGVKLEQSNPSLIGNCGILHHTYFAAPHHGDLMALAVL